MKNMKIFNAKNIIIFTLIILFVSLIIISYFDDSKPKILDGYTLYQAEDYEIQCKSDWNYQNTYANNLPVLTFQSTDNLGLLYICVGRLQENTTLEKYKDESTATIRKQENMSIIKEEKITLANLEAYQILTYDSVSNTYQTLDIIIEGLKGFLIVYNDNEEYKQVYKNMEDTLIIY